MVYIFDSVISYLFDIGLENLVRRLVIRIMSLLPEPNDNNRLVGGAGAGAGEGGAGNDEHDHDDEWVDLDEDNGGTETESEISEPEAEESDTDEEDDGILAIEEEPEPNVPGCKHYKRKCQIVCPLETCGKIFTCRLCHDEAEPSHQLDRHGVREVVCVECKARQPVAGECRECSVVFGEYFCSVCNLFMSPNPEKPPYHCEGCNICRIGPKDHFFHCENCDMCLPIGTKGKHRCVEKSSHNSCAVCLEDIHSSRSPAHLPPCGHLIHLACYKQMLRNSLYTCPSCNESMASMTKVWEFLDEQMARSAPLPPEYANKEVEILCRDCHKFSTILFHFVGLKCGNCGGYNTTLERGIDFHNLAGTGPGAVAQGQDGANNNNNVQEEREPEVVGSGTAVEPAPIPIGDQGAGDAAGARAEANVMDHLD